jgi:hypothetical protein
MKPIYALLIIIIKNAHKVTVADAIIFDNVFKFLEQDVKNNCILKMILKNTKELKLKD